MNPTVYNIPELKFKNKGPKIPHFHLKNDVTLYTIDFQIMPFMVQNKNQIASNTHKYKKIVKKILT